MSNSKLYQPPPPPPKMPMAPVDPLLALSKAPTVIAAAVAAPAPVVVEELTDLTDDEALEEWAKSGTKVMPKTPSQPPQSQAQPQPVGATMASAPLPSFYPVAYSTAPQIREKKTSAAIWVVPLALFVFAGGVVAAAAGWYVYHTSDLATAATVDTSSNVVTTAAPTETAPPAVTLTATSSTTPTVVASASAAPKATSNATSTSLTRRQGSSSTNTIASTSTSTSTSLGNGAIRTFAAGNGKPVYVDGKQVGVGGGRITTACGHHMVSVGTGHARGVEIPCNGATLTVGTPDGT
jgi:hypothetical protein